MNRHRTILLTCGLTLILGLVTPVLAENVPASGRGVDARLDNEAARISAGIRDGSLTEREARRLQNVENRIRAEEERFKADGRFTPRERQKVARDENRLSRQIYRQRHDAQRRR